VWPTRASKSLAVLQQNGNFDEVANLPPAILAMLADLAQDGGRARADVLERILADPDGFRAYIDEIDSALGSTSAGKSKLRRLLRLAEKAISPTSGKVKDQHYVSQVVLRQFVEPVKAGRVLTRHDLVSGLLNPIGTRGVAYLEHFVAVDSVATEKLWQKVENALRPAIDVALRGVPLRAAQRSTLRNAVALHFVRNPQTVDAHDRAFEEAAARQVEQWADTPFAEEAFRRHTGGLVPAGPEGRRIGIERSQGRLRDIHALGGLFRLSVQRLYEKVGDRFDTKGLQVMTPANARKEFLLGDVPAITYNATTGAAGLSEGVAVDDADEIVMPLAPLLMVAIGPPDGVRSLSDAEVDHYNRMQVRAARSFVMYRPTATHFANQVAAWR
jgi:hypothetical protein